MQVLGWSPKGPLAGLAGGTDASGVADGSFDAVLGGMLETPGASEGPGAFGGAGSGGSGVAGSGVAGSGVGSSEAASSEAASGAAASGALFGQFVGSLQGVPGARHDPQRGIEPAYDVASPTVHLDDPLSIRRPLSSTAQEAVERGSASSPLIGGVPGAVGTVASGGQGGAGNARPASASAVPVGGSLAGSGTDAVEVACGGVASSNGRLDDSLSIRRLLPSNAQEAVETGSASSPLSGTGVPVASGAGVGGGQGLAALAGVVEGSGKSSGVGSTPAVSGGSAAGSGTDAVEVTSGQFVASLQGVPGARHDRQRGIESASEAASSTVHVDDPLSIRRLLPSTEQEAVEGGSASSPLTGGVPGAVGTGVGSGQDAAISGVGGNLAAAGGAPVAGGAGVGGGQGAALGGVVEGSGMSSGVGSASAMPGGGSLAGSGSDAVEVTSGRFVASLQGVPGARHDPQRGIETGSASSPVSGTGVPVAGGTPSKANRGGAVVGGPGPAGASAARSADGGMAEAGSASAVPVGVPGAGVTGVGGGQGFAVLSGVGGSSAVAGGAPVTGGASVGGGQGDAALAGVVEGSEMSNRVSSTSSAALDQAVLVQATPGQAAPDQAVLVQATPGQAAPGQATPVQPTQAQPTQPPNHQPLHQQPPNHQPLNHQLAQPLFALASAKPGEHVMTLRVSPEDLGPLTVRAHIDHAGVRIELFAAGDAGREAVRHVLPELRRGLEDAGATLNLSSQDSPQDSPHDNPQDAPTDRGGQRRHEPAFQAPVPRSIATGREPEQPKQDPETNRLDILV
ncbi:flagellar hook-length control protein FliK [Paenarthrobacter sp. NPDC018779]|uniref:flagellar hook-length control protein FliK n=1 Tax=Paenarthrobacter sp. NPDC018779 TaxID=3364375 RepID=UPI0037CB69F9